MKAPAILGLGSVLIGLLVAACPYTAFASECEHGFLDDETVRNVGNIAVFRLVSAELDRTSAKAGRFKVFGKVEVIQTLRGNLGLKQISYSTDRQCGSRLDIGSYYAIFSPKAGETVEANSGNVVELGNSQDVAQASIKLIQLVMDDKVKFEDAFPRTYDRIDQEPVTPPCMEPKTRTSHPLIK